ncbi:hypothetical protein ACTXG6_19720 [Pseudonocardia sp. Cha107L01]|jgi:hypothetical protein
MRPSDPDRVEFMQGGQYFVKGSPGGRQVCGRWRVPGCGEMAQDHLDR